MFYFTILRRLVPFRTVLFNVTKYAAYAKYAKVLCFQSLTSSRPHGQWVLRNSKKRDNCFVSHRQLKTINSWPPQYPSSKISYIKRILLNGIFFREMFEIFHSLKPWFVSSIHETIQPLQPKHAWHTAKNFPIQFLFWYLLS